MLYPQKVGNHFADKRRSLGQYSSLPDSDHGVSLVTISNINMAATRIPKLAVTDMPLNIRALLW
jgi:hypothetical protein